MTAERGTFSHTIVFFMFFMFLKTNRTIKSCTQAHTSELDNGIS